MSIIGKEDRMSVVSMAADEVDSQASGQDEQIFVSVRLRPLNGKEIARNDVCDWECISNTTIIFKSSMPERSMFPTAYTFDRVFDCDCSTRQVYEEAAKDVALSVVSGINASVFAYGQTSSGKTYTMSGITEYAIADIFDYIDKQQERKFVIKFSAIEIYNEAVRDLLSGDSTHLRVLDDPEKGIIVEKVIEETVTGWSHLKELLSICEAQRQIGETCLNETSSRSHQIIRLTVESSAREPTRAGRLSALTATVNFIDLAGSERASQTLAAGSRLKEGSHINRSLLTLGTVIRKLSKGRNGHIPYRDSKLTRILQNSLGGNARTAIICNMSPARTHVEQSKNTLQFASCAKEVSTHPQLNVLMSDKVLVKQLQKELARLESELKCLGSVSVSSNSAELLREKDTIIEQLEKEIKELTWQRDLAQSRLESLLQSDREDRPLRKIENTESESSEVINPLRLGIGLAQRNTIKDFEEPSSKQILQIVDNQEDNFLLDDSTPKFFGLDPGRGWEEIAQRNTEDACKEVQCIEVEQSILNTKSEGEAVSFGDKEKAMTGATRDEEVATTEKAEKPSASADNYESLKQKIQELQKTINSLVQCPPPSEGHPSSSQGLTWTKTKSRRSVLMTIPSALWSGEEEENENMPHAASEGDAKVGNLARKDSEDPTYASDAESVKEIEVDRDDTTTVIDFVAGVNKLGRFQSGSEIPDNPAPEASAGMDGPRRSTIDLGAGVHDVRQHHTNWPIKFERYRRKIIELWARCNVSLVHRSYFFLLFKGDPSDNVYMEVELRRLYFLRDTSSSRGNSTEVDSQIPSPTTSLKALYREREMLAKQLQKKFTKKEREQIYLKWSIDLDSKQRSLQLARRLWTDVRDIKHVRDSANLVATLIGFVEPRYAPKELFGLSFLNPLMNQKSSAWKDNMSSLSLL